MQERIKKFLQNIGLSEKESSVYLALLSVDTYSVLELSKATKINRTTLYPVLDELINKKLVIEIKQDKKVRFQAESPERIETYIQNQKNQLEEQEKVLEDIIPQMRGFVRNVGEKPVVKFFEGREGILESLNTYYESGDNEKEEYLIYPRRDIKDLFSPKEQERAKNSRIKRNIFMNSIFTADEDYPSNELANRYRINSDLYKISAEIGVYSDRVYIHILSSNMSAVYIKSKDVAETMKVLFKLAIEGLKNKK